MKEYIERNHRGHRAKINSLCPQKEFPLKAITDSQNPYGENNCPDLSGLTYMKAMKKKAGLLINFNVERLKAGIKRLVL